ncbi:MAG: phosphoribosyl-ATP pyrophosphohydrolase [Proteobacteria bacterium]|nr:phosphoribosyl-ATP pyrophosphohydrolase [Pseudomonadota bacterium]
MVTHNKLVRDKIPEIIRNDGKTCSVRILEHWEMNDALGAKLREEVDEYLIANDAEELADILEVVYASAERLGVSKDELEEIRAAKAAKNGGFGDRIYLLEVAG